jgi:hypothetical protein
MGRIARSLGATLIAQAFVLGACSSGPSPDASPLVAVDQGQGFVLTMALPTDHFASGQAIEVRTTLTWTGPAATAGVWGSGHGPVGFVVQEVTGRRTMGGAMTSDCRMTSYDRGVATPIPFGKGVAFSADDPAAAFYRKYAGEPDLRLPPGRWRITAILDAFVAPCAGDAPRVSLRTTVEIGVG